MRDENTMLRYIEAEPDDIRRIVRDRERYTAAFVKHFLSHPVKRVYLSGNGSPHSVCVVAGMCMERLLGVEASSSLPAVLNRHAPFNANGVYRPEEMLLICPAQTGRTTGPIESARLARAAGIPVLCTTLSPGGALARECDIVIEKPTGFEESFPESRGHVASMVILLLCAVEAARALGRLDADEYRRWMDGFERLPESCGRAADAAKAWYADHRGMMLAADAYRFVGYGPCYGTLQESCLKILETTRRPSMAYELEEFLHGSGYGVKEDSVVFFVCAEDGPERERAREIYRWFAKKSKNCVLVCSGRTPGRQPNWLVSDFLDLPLLSAVEYLVPFQVLSHLTARELGLSTLTQAYPEIFTELHAIVEA